jgi:hypothetical protein
MTGVKHIPLWAYSELSIGFKGGFKNEWNVMALLLLCGYGGFGGSGCGDGCGDGCGGGFGGGFQRELASAASCAAAAGLAAAVWRMRRQQACCDI